MYQGLPLTQLADAARIERRFDARPARSARSGRLVRNRQPMGVVIKLRLGNLHPGDLGGVPGRVHAVHAVFRR